MSTVCTLKIISKVFQLSLMQVSSEKLTSIPCNFSFLCNNVLSFLSIIKKKVLNSKVRSRIPPFTNRFGIFFYLFIVSVQEPMLICSKNTTCKGIQRFKKNCLLPKINYYVFGNMHKHTVFFSSFLESVNALILRLKFILGKTVYIFESKVTVICLTSVYQIPLPTVPRIGANVLWLANKMGSC